MAGEFGPSHYSNDSGHSNSAKQTENGAQQANRPAREYHDYSVQQEAPAKKKGRGRGVMRSLATAAVATVAAATILPTLAGPSVDVRFEYLNATDSVLEYVLTIENAEEDDEISVLVVTASAVYVCAALGGVCLWEGVAIGLLLAVIRKREKARAAGD